MKGFAILVRKEIREQWRTARLLVVGAIFLVFGLISPLTAKYTPELISMLAGDLGLIVPPPTTRDSIDQLIKNLGQMGPLIAIVLAMGAVAREKERGTAAMVLIKPVSRSAFLAAKFVGLAVTLSAGMALAGVATYGYTALLFEMLPVGGFIAGCALLLLPLLVYTALTLLGSTLVRSSLPAAGIGLAALMVLSIIGAFPQLSQLTPGALYPSVQALSLGFAPEALLPPLAANLGLIAAALLLAWSSFRRQEL